MLKMHVSPLAPFTTSVEIYLIASFPCKNVQKEACKHNACSKAIEFLRKLAKLEEPLQSTNPNKCECKKSAQNGTVSTFQVVRSNKNVEISKCESKPKEELARRDQLKNNGICQQPSPKEEIATCQQALLSKLTQLITNFNSVKGNDSRTALVKEFNEISPMPISLSAETCDGPDNKNTGFSVEVKIDNIFSYIAKDSTEKQCKSAALAKAVRFLNNLSNLATNFRTTGKKVMCPSLLLTNYFCLLCSETFALEQVG